MIGRIRGKLIHNEPPNLVVEASGVGYEIEAPIGTCAQLQLTDDEVTLHTHLSVSENAHQLFGFISQRDRKLFRNLIKINGVGPKLGLAILSAMQPEEFVFNIHNNEVNRLVKIPGVGKKTAERLVIELRDKLDDWSPADQTSNPVKSTPNAVLAAQHKSHEVESALLALGYKSQQVNHILSNLAEKVDFAETETAELIRLALKSTNS